MNSTYCEPHATRATLDLSPADKHCVFRSGAAWFALPAVSIREISMAPDMVPVPNCHTAFAGLCHLRSEFIPVIILNALFDFDFTEVPRPNDKLMVIHSHSPWALRIAEVSALESIETLVTPEARGDDVNQTAVIGTCVFRHQLVRVLDPTRVFRIAQRALETFWQSNAASSRSGCHDIGNLS